MGRALTKHLGEITLRVNIHKQNPFVVHGKPRTDAVDTGAFADATLLVGDCNDISQKKTSPTSKKMPKSLIMIILYVDKKV